MWSFIFILGSYDRHKSWYSEVDTSLPEYSLVQISSVLLFLQKRGEHVRQPPRIAHRLDHVCAFQSQAECARGPPPTLVRVSFSFFKNVTPILHKDLPTEICIISRLRYCNPLFLGAETKEQYPRSSMYWWYTALLSSVNTQQTC